MRGTNRVVLIVCPSGWWTLPGLTNTIVKIIVVLSDRFPSKTDVNVRPNVPNVVTGDFPCRPVHK